MHIDKTMQKPSERITVLVTGANGQLGREMRRAAAGSKDRYVFTDVTELDIADADAVDCGISTALRMIADKDELTMLSKNISRLAVPDAADRVADEIVKYWGE